MSKPNIEAIWKELAKYGIHSERDLDKAIENMTPLNIGCMVSPVKIANLENGREG
jgi:hypothetical protein